MECECVLSRDQKKENRHQLNHREATKFSCKLSENMDLTSTKTVFMHNASPFVLNNLSLVCYMNVKKCSMLLLQIYSHANTQCIHFIALIRFHFTATTTTKKRRSENINNSIRNRVGRKYISVNMCV